MSVPLIVRPLAEQDIREIRAYHESILPGLGDLFASRLAEVFRRIESMPELYGVVWRDVRAARLRRFRYVVYYVLFADRADILAVMHGARDPAAWKTRFRN